MTRFPSLPHEPSCRDRTMSENAQSPQRKTSAVPFEPATACEGCGQFGAFRIADRALCGDCIAGAGSCCPEFGKDDLWSEPAEG